MSLGEILSSALTGLGAAQAGMRTISNNIANVNTPGYAREKISLQTSVSSGKVNGVFVGEPSRVADRYLEETVYARAGDAGRADVVAEFLDRVQSLLGANGAEAALPARLDAIASAATAMTAAAGAAQTSAAFVGTVEDAIATMQQLGDDVETIRADAEGAVGGTVDRINTLLRNIGDLNDSVARLTGLGRSTAGLADQRTAAVEELSGLIGVTAREQGNGRIAIETTTGVPLLDQRIRQLSYPVGGAASQPIYPAIEVRFLNPEGGTGAATGERLDTPSVGGRLGGLIDLRDHQLPAFSERLGTLFGGLAQTLNAASNESTAVPPPAVLSGRPTALVAADRLGFAGAATFAVTKADGTLVTAAKVDFGALGAGATVADAVAAINAGLGGAGTASFTNGALTITATGAGNGIAITQDAADPSVRAGTGFSQYFGLNDIVRSDASTLTPSGFVAGDAHGFTTGQTVEFALRDTAGRLMASYTLSPATGGTFGALIGSLNSGALGGYGSFALDDLGRVQFTPTTQNSGATLAVLSDTTDRAGTGRSFSAITAVAGHGSGLAGGEVRRDIVADPGRLPLAQLQNVAVGAKALGSGDRRGAAKFVDALAATLDLGSDGKTTIGRFAATTLGDAGAVASRARYKATETAASRDDAINRRDSFSGVNIDEELGQMVVLQNSYSAAARMMSVASQMYDTLLEIVR